jgi:hypothetical protein
MFNKIKTYVKNMFIFHELLKYHRGYDYYGSMVGLRCAINHLEKTQSAETFWVSVNRDKTCKRMRVVVNSLDRLIQDDYEVLAQQKVDLEIVSSFVSKYWLHCWS